MATFARITGWGQYVPQRVVTNQELAAQIDTTDEEIRALTGIQERHIASEQETTSSMATEAARLALSRASLYADSIEIQPASAYLLQGALGARHAAAFDLIGGCSGFLYGLAVASQFISNGTYRNILVASGEVLSRIINWHDRATCIMFGDGAAAVTLQASDSPGAISFVLGSDGSNGKLIQAPGPCDRPRMCPLMDASTSL